MNMKRSADFHGSSQAYRLRDGGEQASTEADRRRILASKQSLRRGISFDASRNRMGEDLPLTTAMANKIEVWQ